MTTDFESLNVPLSLLDRAIIGTAGLVVAMFILEFILATPAQVLLRLSFEFFSGYFMWTIWENRRSLKKRRVYV